MPNPELQVSGEPNLPESTYLYFEKHGVNSDMATLGRVLFYDKKLSVNNAVSCGSCHKQEFAFADNVALNKGWDGQSLKRNSPSIQGIKGFFDRDSFLVINGNWVFLPAAGIPRASNQVPSRLFWDARQNNVADMVLNPVLNHREMNMPDFESLVKKLEGTRYYPALFTKVYGDKMISKERIAFALEAFLACLNTVKGNKLTSDFSGGTPLSDPLAEQGRILFHNKYNCAKCHDPSNSGDYGGNTFNAQVGLFNIGLDEVYSDRGVGAVSGNPKEDGVFKVPTLKNISVTAPYMHDGRFKDLGEVLDHYSHNIKNNQNLSPLFRNLDGTPRKLNISAAEKIALITFLNTLKDPDFLSNEMYADPFKN
ncbi:MAG TPA: cytochrome c peroxidase [Bacteroidia bacterium]|nr:cytochrome c peroxidase [Bacteroidia bacterium]